jgi:hypothetical protein
MPERSDEIAQSAAIVQIDGLRRLLGEECLDEEVSNLIVKTRKRCGAIERGRVTLEIAGHAVLLKRRHGGEHCAMAGLGQGQAFMDCLFL